MTRPGNRPLCSAAIAAAAIFLGVLATRPAHAQPGSSLPDPELPCRAFSRNDGGDWTVRIPVTLDVAGMAMSFAPGTVFAPNTATHGVSMHDILDRECGNVPTTQTRLPPS